MIPGVAGGARTDAETSVAEDDSKRSPLRGVTRPPRKKYFRRPETAVKLDGPRTRGKYDAQSGPNTRSRARCKVLARVCRGLRLLCTTCWDPARVALEAAAAAHSVTRARDLAHELERLGGRSTPCAVRAAPRTRSKLVKRGSSRLRSAKGKVEQPKPARCELQVEAADPVLRREKIHPTAGFPNINGKVCLSEPPGEEGVRAVLTPCWRRGVCKSTPEANKCGKKAPVTSRRVMHVGKYPTVTLCDISQRCGACRQDCCYTLPEVLKDKSVHCFKQELKAGVHLKPISPHCCQHGFKKNDLVKSNDQRAWTSSCQCQNLGDHDNKGLMQPNTCPARERKTSETSGNCFASFLLGKKEISQELESGTLNRDYKEGPAAEHDHRMRSTEMSAGKRFELCNGSGSLISQQQVEESPLGSTIMCSHSEDVSVKAHPHSSAGSQGDGRRENTAIQEENGLDEPSDSEPQVEEFSCQRVEVYLKKLYVSCARTYMVWPFSNRGPKMSSGSEAHLAGLGNLSSLGNLEAPVNGNNATMSAVDEIKVKLSNVSTDCAIGSVPPDSLHEINEKRKDQRDGKVAVEKSFPPENLCSLDRAGKKLASSLTGIREPLPMSSKMATISSPMRQTGPNNVTRSSWLRSGRETPSSSTSTPLSTPSLLSPSVGDGAIASPLLTSTPDNRVNFSAMPCSWPLASANLNKDVPLPSTSFFSPRHEVGAIDNSPWHDNTDSSSCTHSSTPSHNSFYSCDAADIVKTETEADIFQLTPTNDSLLFGREETLLPSTPVEQWSNIYTDLSLPWPPHSPLSSPTRPSHLPNQRSRVETKDCVKASLDSKTDVLDEITAYEQDILLVDVVQDDPDLFDLPKQSMLKLGPLKSAGPPKMNWVAGGLLSRAGRALLEAKKSVAPATVHLSPLSSLLADPVEERCDRRPWRGQCRATPSPTPSTSWPPTNPAVGQIKLDTNNNQTGDAPDWPMAIQAIKPPSVGSKDWDNGQRLKIREDLGVCRQHQFNSYCRYYFSETRSCMFKVCRYLHTPVEGDEKFCIETVLRFSKNTLTVQKASAVFTDYYQKNSPGLWFSNQVMTCLLWALLKAGLFTDVLSVLNISLVHKITPVPEFLLELFNVVQVNGLTAIVPELLRLTSQMSISGLLPSVDGAVQMSPDFHGNTPSVMPGNHMLLPPPTNGFPESLNLAHAIVEVELCTKHKNWLRLGSVFKMVCQASLLPGDLEQLSGRVAVALLTEINNKLPIPFASFTDTFCQECDDDLMKTTLGRIGISLMHRYHKTHQWVKGRQVVEILSSVQVAFSMLKGLFGNENAASRCCLVTMATELFMLSGCIEGALNTLRDNDWFLASCSWPCEPSDLEKRTHLLMRLTENTSHRDTLEILSNLPGLKQPHESVDVSQYAAVFNAHLQACLKRKLLAVASDLVELMLFKQLAVEAGLLQALLNKLGKQNCWLRAREIFRCALNAGYYPGLSAPPCLHTLCVPSTLGEMEMVLCLEMFISANPTPMLDLADTTANLCITLQRHTCEGAYLSASSRLLSAAGALQPKLTVHFTAVNPAQEQVFTLDMPSVRLWLEHNHSWANAVWSHLSS